MTDQEVTPIPDLPGLPFIGFTDIDTEVPLRSLVRLADQYGKGLHLRHGGELLMYRVGPIYRMTTAGRSRVIISSNALVNEICDEARFAKIVAGPLEVGDPEIIFSSAILGLSLEVI
jgi:cytochrome P450 / NADPH-cytochrome P450 reductase